MAPLTALILLLLGCSAAYTAPDTALNTALDTALDTVSDTAPDTDDKISLSELENLQDKLRQIVFGVPLQIGFSVIHGICTAIVKLRIVQSRPKPDVSKMNFVLHQDSCHTQSVPLTKASKLWHLPGFDQNKPTTIFITGWLQTIDFSIAGPVAKAYRCRNDTNFVVLDAGGYLQTFYTWASLNTVVIGEALAKALLQLDPAYVSSRVHVVGHSLGAQIAGATGRSYKKLSNGRMLSRVTGLDPANPCFYDGDELPGVRSGDASYVDIIISSPGVLGTAKSAGDADFFVTGLSAIKPGCPPFFEPFCSHLRAVDYWVETTYPSNSKVFLGRRCKYYEHLTTGIFCQGERALMGYAANSSIRGLFYVDVNKGEPYGTQADGKYTYSNSKCGKCKATD